MKLRTLLLCAALAAGGACRRNDANQRASEAAQNVTHANADLQRAASDFAVKRDQAVGGYRAELKIYEISIPAAQALVSDPALTQADRDNAKDKISTFQRECDLATQTFDALATSTTGQWDQASSTAEQQMQKVRDAHDDAFAALSVERKLATSKPKTK
jgi:hypothetical protein